MPRAAQRALRSLPCRSTFADLIDRARAGDRSALGTLFRSHQHLLLRYFRGLRAPSPDDLASQVWIDVARSLGGFHGDETAFRRWLFTIARRRFIDSVRRATRKPERLDAKPVEPAATAPSAEEIFDVVDGLERAIGLVRSLPPAMAEAILLRIVADLDVADVASLMGVREGNVRVLVHRGLGRLRGQLAVTDSGVISING